MAYFALLASEGESHAVLSDPLPRYNYDDLLLEYPCGEGQYNEFDMGPTTTLAPGEQAILFRETSFHEGSPYRLALSPDHDDRYDQFVLLDQIYHNDAGSTDSDNYHRVYVTIPDVDCERCGLQLVQVMADMFDGTCAPESLNQSCGDPEYVAFSCANVAITGTETEMESFYVSVDGAEEAQGWTTLSGYWAQGDDGIWEMADEPTSTTSTPTTSPTTANATSSANVDPGNPSTSDDSSSGSSWIVWLLVVFALLGGAGFFIYKRGGFRGFRNMGEEQQAVPVNIRKYQTMEASMAGETPEQDQAF